MNTSEGLDAWLQAIHEARLEVVRAARAFDVQIIAANRSPERDALLNALDRLDELGG